MNSLFYLNGKKVRPQSLRFKSKDDQLEIMRNWFYENYEDPANACPYDGREGGYAYIYGGPYDAHEELQNEFSEYIKPNFIEELATELQYECVEWSGNSNNIDNWYDEDIYNAVISSEKPFSKFIQNIEVITSLKDGHYEEKQKQHLHNILYTNVITALETFYVELFIYSIDKEERYIANYIEKGKWDFKVSKNIISLPFKNGSIENIKTELIKSLKEQLVSASWHNVEQVIKRYKSAFDIKVQKDWPISNIEAATLIRNHLVHRGGKDKEGNIVKITKTDLEELIGHAETLVQKIHKSLDNVLQEPDNEKEIDF
ncbi:MULTISPECIES: hypothetical protein [Atlantibacter]|uniref:hypothetical protein n=1 Tax=Atlantibacter TaxID=1903434 RepID=UPI002584631B|nr:MULTISPECIES: hypothetical protein [Atlantibacter]